MKTIVTLVLMLLAASAAAQSQRRAPLPNVDDLEPAVDVSEPRVAIAQGPPAAPATPPAAAPSSPTSPAIAPPAPPRVEPSPQAADRPAPRVMDSLDLGTTSITGNAELPKVLYIVPWKKSDLGDLVGRPVNTLLDEVLAPVDPAVFERHLSYYDSLYGKQREQE
ncbi:MAG TPA: hypothetical protein VNA66_04065 [Gammaproteobacteria bacterium]|jgi:hypothetical protein|nr:hypothetical protein [Gammaproteobacteria bacterium]